MPGTNDVRVVRPWAPRLARMFAMRRPTKTFHKTRVSSLIAAIKRLSSQWKAGSEAGGRFLKRTKSGSKTDWDLRADRAIEAARKMPPGPARHDAMKRAGLLRLMAQLKAAIAKKERPVRGKKPGRSNQRGAARAQRGAELDEVGEGLTADPLSFPQM